MNEPTNRTSRLRWTLRIAGAMLWVLAILGVYWVWKLTEARRSGDSAPVVTSREPDVTDTPVLTLKSSGEVPPDQIWDPQGIEDFELTERSGETVTKDDLLGKPWAAAFVFTRCSGPCPQVSAQFKMLQDRLKDEDVRLVTFTVDPNYDTPEVLSSYADAMGADPEKWLFLTGDQHVIYGLIHRSFKMPVQEIADPTSERGYDVIHTTNILHVNAEGRVVGKYDARNDVEMAALRRALESEAKKHGASS